MNKTKLPLTPRESLALESARGTTTLIGKILVSGYPGAIDGYLPTIADYNSMIKSGLVDGSPFGRSRGMNW